MMPSKELIDAVEYWDTFLFRPCDLTVGTHTFTGQTYHCPADFEPFHIVPDPCLISVGIEYMPEVR